MSNPAATALRLHQLDQAMRRDAPHRLAVAARVRFYEAAVTNHALHRLPSLARFVRNTSLSERSLDWVFEDARYSAAVRTDVAKLADANAVFRQALVDQVGSAVVAMWRERAQPAMAA